MIDFEVTNLQFQRIDNVSVLRKLLSNLNLRLGFGELILFEGKVGCTN